MSYHYSVAWDLFHEYKIAVPLMSFRSLNGVLGFKTVLMCFFSKSMLKYVLLKLQNMFLE